MLLNNQIKLRRQILLVILLVVAVFLNGCAEKKPKVYRVGILFGLEQLYDSIDGFKKKMTKLGYIEGKDIIYDTHKTNVNLTRDKQILDKFVADKVDLIFVAPTETVLLAREITQGINIPLVFANVILEGNNLVKNVQQPGGHITGVRLPGPEYTAKRLEILHEIIPRAKRVWITYGSSNPNNPPTLKTLRLSASSLGLTLVEVPVTSVAEIRADLEKRDKSVDIGMDAIMIIPDWLSLSTEGLAVIDKFSVEHKIPIVSAPPIVSSAIAPQYPHYVIFSYMCVMTETGGLAAIIADKILQGAPAGTIPVVTPEAYLKINYKAIQELGLAVPEGILSQADEIIR